MRDKLTVKLDVTCLTTEAYIKTLRDGVGWGYINIMWDGSYWHVSSDALRSRAHASSLERAIASMLDVTDEWKEARRLEDENAARRPD